jgi:hypothetical protein
MILTVNLEKELDQPGSLQDRYQNFTNLDQEVYLCLEIWLKLA